MRGTNVDGPVHMTRFAVDGTKACDYGRMVNLTSVAAHGTAISGTTFYAATKAAVIALTRRFALELGLHGITVNAVAPGLIPTGMATGGSSPAEAQMPWPPEPWCGGPVFRTISRTLWRFWFPRSRASSLPKPLRWTAGAWTTSRMRERALSQNRTGSETLYALFSRSPN